MSIDLAIQLIGLIAAFGAFGGVFKYRMDQQESRVSDSAKAIVEQDRGLALLQANVRDKSDRIFSLEASRTFMEEKVATMHGEIKVLRTEDGHLDKRLDSLIAELKATESRIISRIDQLTIDRS